MNNIIWDEANKKSNISDAEFKEMIKDGQSKLLHEDRDFIITSFDAKMYNHVLEYVFNKSIKVLQDAVFSLGEDVVINVTHWIDRTFISNFFDVFVLRLACDLDFITKKEKIIILYTIELLQKYNSNFPNGGEMDKEMVKFLITSLYNAILTKDFSLNEKDMRTIVKGLTSEEIVVGSKEYEDILNLTNRHKNLFARIMFAMLKTMEGKDPEEYKVLSKNAINLFPTLWESTNLNNRKFISYYLKSSSVSSVLSTVFHDLSGEIDLQDFTTDLNVVTTILKNCQDTLACHYSINNYGEETASLLRLFEVSSYPNYFLRSVITPCIITYLGNNNGVLEASRRIAEEIFGKLSPEKWTFYFKNFFRADDFVLMNLIAVPVCLKDWCQLIKKCGVNEEDFEDEEIKKLIMHSKKQEIGEVVKVAKAIYFGKDQVYASEAKHD